MWQGPYTPPLLVAMSLREKKIRHDPQPWGLDYDLNIYHGVNKQRRIQARWEAAIFFFSGPAIKRQGGEEAPKKLPQKMAGPLKKRTYFKHFLFWIIEYS